VQPGIDTEAVNGHKSEENFITYTIEVNTADIVTFAVKLTMLGLQFYR